MVHPALVAERDGQLPGAALALPDQEAAINEGGQQVLSGAARHRPVVPAVLLQAVDWRDVVGRHPALAVLGAHLTPLAILVVAQHAQLLTWGRQKVTICFVRWLAGKMIRAKEDFSRSLLS